MGWADDYEPVENRLRDFHAQHPYGRVTTDLIFHEGGDYIVKATIYRGDEVGATPPAATGLAHDSVDSLPANMKASALEVCETSAIGRALANLGYAPKGKRPSREEMLKASPVPHVAAPPNRRAAAENESLRDSTGETSLPEPTPKREALAEGGGVRPGQGLTSEGVSGGSVIGEGPSAAPPSDALAALLEACGGSEVKAINAINKAMHTAYRKSELETLEPEDWAAGLAHVRGNQ